MARSIVYTRCAACGAFELYAITLPADDSDLALPCADCGKDAAIPFAAVCPTGKRAALELLRAAKGAANVDEFLEGLFSEPDRPC